MSAQLNSLSNQFLMNYFTFQNARFPKLSVHYQYAFMLLAPLQSQPSHGRGCLSYVFTVPWFIFWPLFTLTHSPVLELDIAGATYDCSVSQDSKES